MTKEELQNHKGPVWVLEYPLALPMRWDSWSLSDTWDGMVLSPGERYPFSLLAVFPTERAALAHRLDAVTKTINDYQRHRVDLMKRLAKMGVNP